MKTKVQTTKETFPSNYSEMDFEGDELVFCYKYTYNQSIFFDEVYDEQGNEI